MVRFSLFWRITPAATLLGVAVTVGLAGCGSTVAPKPGPAVNLTLAGPAQASRTSHTTATVHGTVTPHRARVDVLGRRVTVSRAGSFSTRVALSLGPNLIDVEASVPRSAGAVTAVSVTRFQLVTVPNVVGDTPAQAVAALRALGLSVKSHGSSDPFSFLIPGTTNVCSINPRAGSKVDPAATVTIKTSKFCL